MKELNRRGHMIVCPKCGCEIMPAGVDSFEFEVICDSASDSQLRLPCGCIVWERDIRRFNRKPGQRSLEYGCFNEDLISPKEKIRIFSYISESTKIERMLLHLGYQMVFVELPSDREMEKEDDSYPVCSGEETWTRGMSIAYVNRQFCRGRSFFGNTHIAVVGVISDWRQVADLIDLRREREDRRQERQGRDWPIFTRGWERRPGPRRTIPTRIKQTLEASKGFRMIFGRV